VNKSLELAEREDPLKVVGSGVASRVEAEERVSEVRRPTNNASACLQASLPTDEVFHSVIIDSHHLHVLKKNAAM